MLCGATLKNEKLLLETLFTSTEPYLAMPQVRSCSNNDRSICCGTGRCVSCSGRPCQNSRGNEIQHSRNTQPETNKQEKSPQARSQGVFSQIEDATYEILRKHEKQSV